jgi:glycosyltransferase involved in cell wall biosynthesis
LIIMAKIFIGMPVYNGGIWLERSLAAIRGQSFSQWELFISDNASEDETQLIAKGHSLLDPRITYYRQDHNIGAVENFKFLLDRAKGEFFIWVAADDLWDSEFLSSCVKLLEKNKLCGFGFCNIVNIDGFDRIIRTYPDFSRFACKNNYDSVITYIRDYEVLGKANLIYSLFRLEYCRAAWQRCPLTDMWGADMCFVVAALTIAPACIDRRVLFNKRLVRSNDQFDFADPIFVKSPAKSVPDFRKSLQYARGLAKAVKGMSRWDIYFIIIMKLCRMLITRLIIMSEVCCIYFIKKLFQIREFVTKNILRMINH